MASQPDIMVTAKGLSGGLYPISAALVNEKAGGWLNEDGAAHISHLGRRRARLHRRRTR